MEDGIWKRLENKMMLERENDLEKDTISMVDNQPRSPKQISKGPMNLLSNFPISQNKVPKSPDPEIKYNEPSLTINSDTSQKVEHRAKNIERAVFKNK